MKTNTVAAVIGGGGVDSRYPQGGGKEKIAPDRNDPGRFLLLFNYSCF